MATSNKIAKMVEKAKERRAKSIFKIEHENSNKSITSLDKNSRLKISRKNIMHEKMRSRRTFESIRMWIILIFTLLVVAFVVYYYLHSEIITSE